MKERQGPSQISKTITFLREQLAIEQGQEADWVAFTLDSNNATSVVAIERGAQHLLRLLNIRAFGRHPRTRNPLGRLPSTIITEAGIINPHIHGIIKLAGNIRTNAELRAAIITSWAKNPHAGRFPKIEPLRENPDGWLKYLAEKMVAQTTELVQQTLYFHIEGITE